MLRIRSAVLCIFLVAAGVALAPPRALGAGSTPAEVAPIDYAALDRLIGDARFVVLGEDAHGQPAMHELVARMFRHLVEKEGFRTFVFESAWQSEQALQAFLASDRRTLNKEETFFLSAFASAPITELLLWAREYNAAHPDDPVRFTGFQPQQPVSDANALRAFAAQVASLDGKQLDSALAECDLPAGRHASDLALMLAHNANRQKKIPSFTPQARASCIDALRRLERRIDRSRAELERESSPGAVSEAKLRILSLRTYAGTLSELGDRLVMRDVSPVELGRLTGNAYETVDKVRFDIFEGLMRTRERSGRVFLWMHNWHAARNAQKVSLVHEEQVLRGVSVGQRLSLHHGADLVTIGTIVPSAPGEEPVSSLEPAFRERFGERAALVALSGPAAVSDLPVGKPGTLIAQNTHGVSARLENIVLREQFDGLIYLPRADALPDRSSARAKYGDWGVDLASRDLSVQPGKDFYRHTNGQWLATQTIPADRSHWTSFDRLFSVQDERLRGLIEELPANAPSGSNERKVGDYYRAYLDTDAMERAGLAPARFALDAIAAARTHADIASIMGRQDLQLEAPIRFGVTLDEKNPQRFIVIVGVRGLGLPDRDYYLKQDEASKQLRDKYLAYIERMLTLAGESTAAAQARAILDVETQIAERHWPAVKRRDRELRYNLRTREQVEALAPRFPWTQMLTAASLQDQKEFVVKELDTVTSLAEYFLKTPVDVWQSYLKLHFLDGNADVLPQAFGAAAFDFNGRVLKGQTEQSARWKRAVGAVGGGQGALNFAVGQLYVERYFPPQSKAQVLDLVENLRLAFAERIRRVTWMTEPTRQLALQKLAAFRPKIGYPDKPRDYSGLEVVAGDALGNLMRSRAFEWRRGLDFLQRPVDRDEWFLPPHFADAYYNATFNEIVFPAGILQPPFFDPHADPAVNFGAIGAVIGHEMGHGFDDQGAKSDAQGVLRTWWTSAEEKAFKQLGDVLAAQYDRYEVLPGLHVNGRLTLGENIGDLSGVTIAHEAYRLSLRGREAPVLDGVTGDQRFFLAWAQVWCGLMREESLRNLVMTNPHSPMELRVNGVVRNVDAWYAAFDIKPGDELYLPPEQRVRIW